MKRRIGILFILWLALIFQTSFFRWLFDFAAKLPFLSFLESHTFDLVLLMLIYISLHRSFWTVWIWASIMSIASEALGVAWKGSQTLSFFAIATLLALFKKHLMIRTPLLRVTFVGLITLTDALIQYWVGSVGSHFPKEFGNYLGDVCIQIFLNASIAMMVFSALIEFDYFAQGYKFAQHNVIFSDGRRDGFKII